MIHNQDTRRDEASPSGHLSQLAVWALAFGCAVGWGSFVMPGTTFLPIAGPWGSVLGLLIGAVIMLLIGVNYRYMMGHYPDAGGSYTYSAKVLGSDHGYLCAWMLILTYAAVIWANSTALSLIIRYLFGNVLCFGFTYQIAGYTVYMGEALVSMALIAAACLICVAGKRLSALFQIIFALLLFGGITICFITVVIHKGGLGGIAPAFSSSGDPVVQVLAFVTLAPWAYIGFESISHSAGEFRFSPKKSLPVIAVALVTAALAYIMLTLCAALSVPDGFRSWSEYIGSLSHFEGITGLPTFLAAQQAMGKTGLAILGIAAFCGIMTALIGNMIALSRLLCRMSEDRMAPRPLKKLNKRGVPATAICCISLFSFLIPLLGRTTIGWIVDVTTIGATIVYAYISICALILGSREKKRTVMFTGAVGTLISVLFAISYLLPSFSSESELAAESYMILILWSIIGMAVFLALMRRDKRRNVGKSTVVWIILFCLILLLSISWFNRTTLNMAGETAEKMSEVQIELAGQAGLAENDETVIAANRAYLEYSTDFAMFVRRNIFVFSGTIFASFAVIFGIFNVIRRREQKSHDKRLIAEENSRAKSAFLSNMSHDIRTPMNAITGYTALALREEGLTDSVRGYLEKIDTSGKQLLTLINDILDMSRIESGKMELYNAPADLCELLDEAYHIFDLQMEHKSLHFTVDYSEVRDRRVVCDKNCLTRVLMNLISNAYKFTPSGGSVKVVMRQTESTAEEGAYELSVSDTGIGMSPEFAEHIFDEFERERNSTVDEIQGTGLGMAITKSFVELMGGTIGLETERDKGTTFTIELRFPISREEEGCDEPDPALTEQADLSGVRILLAEDNPINSEIATMILSQNGFTTETAENGKLAVEMLQNAEEGYYGAILMDIRMPVMNGFEAARAIRAMEGERARIPIIALTANTFEDDRREAFDSGMDDHVNKPFNPDELVAKLASHIKSRKTEESANDH